MSRISLVRTNQPIPNEQELQTISKTTEWRKNNPEKAAAQRASYKTRQIAANAAYEARNAERRIAMRKANYEAYKERRALLRANKAEVLRQQARQWRAMYPDKARLSARKWQAANPERVREIVRARRARVSGAQGTLSVGVAERLMAKQKGLCAVCRCSLATSGQHLDHIVALSKGGCNDDANVQLLCPSCNHSKQARDPVEFMQSRGFLL